MNKIPCSPLPDHPKFPWSLTLFLKTPICSTLSSHMEREARECPFHLLSTAGGSEPIASGNREQIGWSLSNEMQYGLVLYWDWMDGQQRAGEAEPMIGLGVVWGLYKRKELEETTGSWLWPPRSSRRPKPRQNEIALKAKHCELLL